jgi:hypothetical protein
VPAAGLSAAGGALLRGKLLLVDLAGSERLSLSKARPSNLFASRSWSRSRSWSWSWSWSSSCSLCVFLIGSVGCVRPCGALVGQAEGDLQKETIAINKSLSALSEVVSARAAKGARTHTPYRNSTLTFLLQDALSGRFYIAFARLMRSEHSPPILVTETIQEISLSLVDSQNRLHLLVGGSRR